ncbi:putative uricase [Acidisarcina polymorpha]|uniref:Uricase n=1 Tax=Acidisarcina polymorpha TaxID=2211140 RepID=A0A2Z5FXZ8_9BACT|nr:putative uricase [Acidisarcina polymorpha]
MCEWSVNILIQGDYENCFGSGDNSEVLPTDTMKNTVYSLARESTATCIEDFGKELAAHFLSNYSQARTVSIDIKETSWDHLMLDGHLHPTTFHQQSGERQTVIVTATRGGTVSVVAGISGLVILKTSDSSFSGYIKDRFTTLRETSDRLLGTDVTASWTYDSDSLHFDRVRPQVRTALLSAFAEHKSLSVQHTLFAMAAAALDQVANILDVTLTMPNKHCLLVDLSPFGQDNPNQIFVPTDEPHGYIEATVKRDL